MVAVADLSLDAARSLAEPYGAAVEKDHQALVRRADVLLSALERHLPGDAHDCTGGRQQGAAEPPETHSKRRVSAEDQ